MKRFKDGRLRFAAYDVETDAFSYLSLGDVVEDAELAQIEAVRQALGAVVDGQIQEVTLTESYVIV